MKVFLFAVLLISNSVFSDEVFKARLIDSNGQFRGYRGIRDLNLCGTEAGPVFVSEEALAEKTAVQNSLLKMHIDCTSTEQSSFFERTGLMQQEILPKIFDGAEVRTLMNQGPSKNRIDLTIVGDGYTFAEKQKFFEDAQKVTDDLFGRDTFATYLSLFNVHAVFIPSTESGIGDGRPKNTALGLYRDSQARQAVICAYESNADRAIGMAPDTDYPILLGNDAFYGGLGGQYAITTSAPLNITTVLRHELGHNFGRVGEEYDGGQVYSGANFSRSTNVSWKHLTRDGEVRAHAMGLIHYSAPWKEINSGDLNQAFTTSLDSRILFDFSSLGFDTKDDAEVYVDGVLTPYSGRFNYDRNFYMIEKRLAKGRHTLKFHRKAADTNNIVSKIAIYTVPDDFEIGSMDVGAYATYDYSGGLVGYRPTERTCLMKDMSSHQFCNVCTENMWRNFLQEVSLIDGVMVSANSVSLKTIPLGIDRLRIQWFKNGKLREDLTGKTDWTFTADDKGNWTVVVTFVSSEIRDPMQSGYTAHKANFVL